MIHTETLSVRFYYLYTTFLISNIQLDWKEATVMYYYQPQLVMEVARIPDWHQIHIHLEVATDPVFLPAIFVGTRAT